MASWDALLPEQVEIIEVGPRDGFQILPQFIPTVDKIRITRSLVSAGIERMEATSFVSPKAVPQMADASEVLAALDGSARRLFVMVPNLKGAERAIGAGARLLNLIVSASESHNRSNVRMSVDASLAGFEAVVELARGHDAGVRASIATAFGCPFEGAVPVERVLAIAARLVKIGCIEICLADTTGMANPRQVASVAERARTELGVPLAFHFHNTRGAGTANILAAMQSGIRSFETGFGGLGGCPFAPGATGNVCTEDVVHMLHEMHIETGIDLVRLLDAVREAQTILKLEFPGQIIKAGCACDLHPLPA